MYANLLLNMFQLSGVEKGRFIKLRLRRCRNSAGLVASSDIHTLNVVVENMTITK
jgi:hypothetical protein